MLFVVAVVYPRLLAQRVPWRPLLRRRSWTRWCENVACVATRLRLRRTWRAVACVPLPRFSSTPAVCAMQVPYVPWPFQPPAPPCLPPVTDKLPWQSDKMQAEAGYHLAHYHRWETEVKSRKKLSKGLFGVLEAGLDVSISRLSLHRSLRRRIWVPPPRWALWACRVTCRLRAPRRSKRRHTRASASTFRSLPMRCTRFATGVCARIDVTAEILASVRLPSGQPKGQRDR